MAASSSSLIYSLEPPPQLPPPRKPRRRSTNKFEFGLGDMPIGSQGHITKIFTLLGSPFLSVSADDESNSGDALSRENSREPGGSGGTLPRRRNVHVTAGAAGPSTPPRNAPRSPSPTPSVESSRFTVVAPPSPSYWTLGDVFTGSASALSRAESPDIANCTGLFTPSASPSLSRSDSSKGFFPRLWNALSSPSKDRKGKDRKGEGRRSQNRHISSPSSDFPLDGEEGELIDDEACFVDARETLGIDIISLLPPEIALYILVNLDLAGIMSCLSVSKYWRELANDSVIWRDLFYRNPGWKINGERARRRIPSTVTVSTPRIRTKTGLDSPRKSYLSTPINRTSLASLPGSPFEATFNAFASNPLPPLRLDWQSLYKTRLEVDRRWISAEPKAIKIAGHTDSVYCLEFDSKILITGSRDKTIKIWHLQTHKLIETKTGHDGSVLCLKFDSRTGFMVSGSSDRCVFVWDLNVRGAPHRAELKGHSGGVLDLRMDEKWIVSCSKDSIIRIWSRATLEPHITLTGHDGPVNAVGLQDGKVVSASGDNKMIMWDIESGNKLRVFEGHDRGLACIDFKGDLIISGSNDRKIKIWSASSGACLQTLRGHDSLVRALSFDPISQKLISASYDKSVKVWDLTTGKCTREFSGYHGSHIFDVKFDGVRIITTSHDQKIVVLDFGTDLDTSLFV